jgi:hypothetical protein
MLRSMVYVLDESLGGSSAEDWSQWVPTLSPLVAPEDYRYSELLYGTAEIP